MSAGSGSAASAAGSTIAAVAFNGRGVSCYQQPLDGTHVCRAFSTDGPRYPPPPSIYPLSRKEIPSPLTYAFLPTQSQPLYFKSFIGGSEEFLKLQLAAYAALDVVEEKVAERKGASARAALEVAAGGSGGAALAAAAKDPFLNMLMLVDEYKV